MAQTGLADNPNIPAGFTHLGRDSLEQIRRREVSRILERIDPPPEEGEAIERFSRLLVAELLLGPISEAMTRVETWATQRARDHEHLQSFEEVKNTLSRWSQGYLG